MTRGKHALSAEQLKLARCLLEGLRCRRHRETRARTRTHGTCITAPKLAETDHTPDPLQLTLARERVSGGALSLRCLPGRAGPGLTLKGALGLT